MSLAGGTQLRFHCVMALFLARLPSPFEGPPRNLIPCPSRLWPPGCPAFKSLFLRFLPLQPFYPVFLSRMTYTMTTTNSLTVPIFSPSLSWTPFGTPYSSFLSKFLEGARSIYVSPTLSSFYGFSKSLVLPVAPIVPRLDASKD